MRLDRLFREEEPLADLTVHEPVGDELENLDLARSGILTDFTRRRWAEWDDGSVPPRAPAGRSRLEPAAVVAIAIEDLLALGSVHASGIGVPASPL